MTCKDCIHRELCADYVSSLAKVQNADVKYISQWLDEIEGRKEQADNACEHFADRSRFVELPCKVGDTVFVVEEIAEERKIIKDHVETIGIGYYADGVNIYQFDGIKTDGYFEDFGKTVFLTREEAEQALKERESNA